MHISDNTTIYDTYIFEMCYPHCVVYIYICMYLCMYVCMELKLIK